MAGVRVLRWSSLKARAVFQYLLLHHGRPVRREVLMELEWPNHSHSSARNNLNVALCSLRNTLDWRGLDVPVILRKHAESGKQKQQADQWDAYAGHRSP